MLKNKERRDSILLGFMAVITVVFLLYVFIPSGGGDKEKKEKPDKKHGNQNSGQSTEDVKKPPVDNKEKKRLDELDKKLKTQLEAIYTSIAASNDPFTNYSILPLLDLQDQLKNPVAEKLLKFNFWEIKDMVNLEFPAGYTGSLKFNLALAVFLVKLKEEKVEEKISTMHWDQFTGKVDFDIYGFINKRVEFEYQMLPVLFYFKQVTRRLNLYPWVDSSRFFREKTADLNDLTGVKHLDKIRKLLAFSARKQQYRIHWREDDGLGADDKKTYRNLSLETFRFLGQEYLLFPNETNRRNNRWLWDLYEADPGEIELINLTIENEGFANKLHLCKIVYTPVNSQFVAVMNEFRPRGRDAKLMVNRMLKKGMTDFHKSYTVIPFDRATNDKTLEKALEQFGHYLKKNKPSIED